MAAPRGACAWLLGAAVLVVLIIAFRMGQDVAKNIDRRLAAAIARADRDDPHWRLDDLLAHRERVSEAENSGLVLDKVLALCA